MTDANLLLGRLAADAPLAGGVSLDAGAAEAVSALAAELGMGTLEPPRASSAWPTRRWCGRCAWSPSSGASTRAAFRSSLRRRWSSARHGARGRARHRPHPLPALERRAVGTRADRDRSPARLGPHGDAARPELTAERVAAEIAALREGLEAGLEGAEAQVTCELRYQGQAFEIAIDAGPGPTRPTSRRRSPPSTSAATAIAKPTPTIELVTVRLALTEPRPEPRPGRAGGGPWSAAPRVRLESEWVEAEILRGEPPAGTETAGPCVFELPETTLVLPPPGGRDTDAHGTIDARRSA